MRIFRKAGSDLEVIYRQRWLDEEESRPELYDPMPSAGHER
jgi:hypothetical protein